MDQAYGRIRQGKHGTRTNPDSNTALRDLVSENHLNALTDAPLEADMEKRNIPMLKFNLS
ncbi:MAG: hypothetical protein M1490_03790 [Candidatus Bathyarchaeota archaeon]|nr:hypothetical protein [Candidatus Bathyarchaeota archaeon]